MTTKPARRPGPLATAPSQLPVPEWARRLSALLDGAIRIPGTEIRIGLDPILGALLPELGDALSGVLSLSLLVLAYQRRVPRAVLARMLVNIGLDALVGAIPVLGDVFDFAFKANEKNLALIERHRGDPTSKASWADRAVVALVLLAALALVAVPLVLATLLFLWLGKLAWHTT